MTLKEAMDKAAAKDLRIRRGKTGPLGRVVEINGTASLEVDTNVVITTDPPKKGTCLVPMALSDILANDWEVEAQARTFHLGIMSIMGPTRDTNILRAFEGDKPLGNTADGSPWIKVVEVLEGE